MLFINQVHRPFKENKILLKWDQQPLCPLQ